MTVIIVPYVLCKNTRIECDPIVLPFPNLRTVKNFQELQAQQEASSEGEIHQLDWPPDEWRVVIGCYECGYVSEYSFLDVDWLEVPKSAPSVFHSGADCFCIEFQCGQKSCKAPTKLHVQKSGLTEAAVRDLLRSPFFIGSLPCGHGIPSLPLDEYNIYKIGGPIE